MIKYITIPRDFNELKEIVTAYDDNDFQEKLPFTENTKFLYDDEKEILDRNISPLIKSLVIEYPYVDKDFRDTYYNDLSKRFLEYNRYSFRVHLFSLDAEKVRQLVDIESQIISDESLVQEYRNNYYGFITLRDTKHHTLGSSFIHPKALNSYNKNNYYMLSPYDVHLAGLIFKVNAFPWMQQDENITRCAHVSIWGILRYFSQKYCKYSEKTIYQITNLTSHDTRKVPSKGLSVEQTSQIFDKCGFSPEIYIREDIDIDGHNKFDRIVYSIVESGLPSIASLNVKHAAAIIGHGPLKNAEKYCKHKKGIIDSHNLIESYILSDDSCLPYSYMDCKYRFIKIRNKKLELHIDEIDALVVPFYYRMYLDIGYIYDEILPFLEKSLIVLQAKCCIRRVFLTSSRSFKRELTKNKDTIYRSECIRSPMPKFVWVIEYATPEEYNNKTIHCRLLLDSTIINHSHPYDTIVNIKMKNSLITRHVPISEIRNDKSIFSRKSGFTKSTLNCETDCMYINNLSNGDALVTYRT